MYLQGTDQISGFLQKLPSLICLSDSLQDRGLTGIYTFYKIYLLNY